jgi:hypothetical protein
MSQETRFVSIRETNRLTQCREETIIYFKTRKEQQKKWQNAKTFYSQIKLYIAYKLPLGFKEFIFVILLVVVTVNIFQHRGGVRFNVKPISLHLFPMFTRHHANINPVHKLIKKMHEERDN